MRTDLADYSSALALSHSEYRGNAQHSLLAPAYCCSLILLLQLPEELSKYCILSALHKGKEKFSSMDFVLSVVPHACDLGKLGRVAAIFVALCTEPWERLEGGMGVLPAARG